jgi:RhoGAP domain
MEADTLRAPYRPAINQVTLKAIVEHLARIAAHAEENKMTASNLAVVFAPVLLSEADHETTSLAAAMVRPCSSRTEIFADC